MEKNNSKEKMKSKGGRTEGGGTSETQQNPPLATLQQIRSILGVKGGFVRHGLLRVCVCYDNCALTISRAHRAVSLVCARYTVRLLACFKQSIIQSL